MGVQPPFSLHRTKVQQSSRSCFCGSFSSYYNSSSGGKGVPSVVLLLFVVREISSGTDVAHAGVDSVEGVGGGVTFREQEEDSEEEEEEADEDEEEAEEVEGDFECELWMMEGTGSVTLWSSIQNVEELMIGLDTWVGLESSAE